MVQGRIDFCRLGERHRWNDETTATNCRGNCGFSLWFRSAWRRQTAIPELYYSLTGPGDVTATFYLPVNPTVDSGNVDGTFAFTVTPIDLTVDGSADPTGYISFYDITYGGGLTIDQGDIFDLINPSSSDIALFVSGTEAAPAMLSLAGDIPLQDYMSGNGGYTLTIKPV